MANARPHQSGSIVKRIVFVVALIWAAGCTLIWTQADMPRRLTAATSPDGTCEVTVSELGSPIFFGPSDIRIRVAWDAEPGFRDPDNVTETETALYNDGKSLDSDNFTITWRDNIPTVTMHGEEQPDQSYTFNWKKVSHRFG